MKHFNVKTWVDEDGIVQGTVQSDREIDDAVEYEVEAVSRVDAIREAVIMRRREERGAISEG